MALRAPQSWKSTFLGVEISTFFVMNRCYKIGRCGSKNCILDMRIFLLARSWAALLVSEKKNPIKCSILAVLNKKVHFFTFFNTKYAQRWTWNLYYPRKPHEFFFTIWKPYKGSFQDQCQNTRTLAGFQSFLTKFARISKMTKMTKIKFEYLQPKFSWLHKFLGEKLPCHNVSKTNG